MARLLKFLSVFVISIICFTNVVFAVERNEDGLEVFNSSVQDYQGRFNSELYDKFYDCFIVEGGKLHFKCSDLSIFANKKFFIFFQNYEISSRDEPRQKVANCPNNLNCYLVATHGSSFVGYSMNDDTLFDRYMQLDALMLSFGKVGSSCDIVFNTVDSDGKTITYSFASKEKNYQILNVDIVKPKPPKPVVKPKPQKPNVPEEKPPKITGDITMKNGGDVLDGIVNVIKGFFKVLAFWGKKIIAFAIGLGIIFVGAKWLWRKLREWLNSI